MTQPFYLTPAEHRRLVEEAQARAGREMAATIAAELAAARDKAKSPQYKRALTRAVGVARAHIG